MPKDKLLSMLGLARRAGKLSMGHDMAEKAVKSHKAEIVLLCSDVSERLVREFEQAVSNAKSTARIFVTDITMEEIHFSLGYRAGVITLDDKNFSKRVIELLKEEQADGH